VPSARERGNGIAPLKPMPEAAREKVSCGSATMVTLPAPHQNWSEPPARYKFGYEDWASERRLKFKPTAK